MSEPSAQYEAITERQAHLRSLPTSTLLALRRMHWALMLLAACWMAASIILGLATTVDWLNGTLTSITPVAIALGLVIGGASLLWRRRVGQILAMLLAIGLLFRPPIATAVGVLSLGLIAMSTTLFGSKRYRPEELETEWARRFPPKNDDR